MGGKNFIGSFSYNVKDSETIDECMKIAKQDGISFSEFIVACLKEQVNQKKVVGQNNPLNIPYGKQEEKPSLGTLDAWISRTEAIRLIKEQDADTCEHIGKNLIVAARFKRTGIYRDVKVI